MDDSDSIMNNLKNDIRRILSKRSELKKRLEEDKKELYKTVRGDLIIGGLLATSIFIIISSIIGQSFQLYLGLIILGLCLVYLLGSFYIPKHQLRESEKDIKVVLLSYSQQLLKDVISKKVVNILTILERRNSNEIKQIFNDVISSISNFRTELDGIIKEFPEIRHIIKDSELNFTFGSIREIMFNLIDQLKKANFVKFTHIPKEEGENLLKDAKKLF